MDTPIVNLWSKRITATAILIGGVVAVSGVAAGANALRHDSIGKTTRIVSDNDLGVGVGNVGVNVPVNACGNSVAVLGKSGPAGCENTQVTKNKGKASVDND
jgi:hypothetical protein